MGQEAREKALKVSEVDRSPGQRMSGVRIKKVGTFESRPYRFIPVPAFVAVVAQSSGSHANFCYQFPTLARC